MAATKRNPKSVLSSEEIEKLYNEVLLYYENDSTDFSGYNLKKNPFLKKLQEEKVFELKDNMKDSTDNTLDCFYYTNSQGTKIESWFFHLRNAFAHNRIFKVLNEDTIRLEDTDGKSLTMCATVSSFTKLIDIITDIKKNYQNEDKNSQTLDGGAGSAAVN